MPSQGYAITEEVANTGGGTLRVKEGEYLGEIVGITVSKAEDWADDSKPAFYDWAIKLVQGPDPTGIGRSMRHRTTMWTPNPSKAGQHTAGQFVLGKLWEASGKGSASELQKLPQASSYQQHAAIGQGLFKGLQGKRLQLFIADRTFPGRNGEQVPVSNIIELGPAASFVDRPAAPVAPANAAGAGSSADILNQIEGMFPEQPVI